jgi:hypothetical protein
VESGRYRWQAYRERHRGFPKPAGPNQGQKQQKTPPRDRDQRGENNNNNNNNSRNKSCTRYLETYDVINDNVAYGHIEKKSEWKTVEHKSEGQKRRQHKRHKEEEKETNEEVILHGIPTLIRGVPAGKKSDEARVKKILRELRSGGYEVKNGDVISTSRQIRNMRKPGFQPITITLNSADLSEDIREAAQRMGILNEREAKPDDKAKDNIGHLRRSLSEKERKKIRKRAVFHESDQGKALKEIKRREAESTTDETGWSKVDLEKDDVVVVETEGTGETGEINDDEAIAIALERR